MHVVVGILNTYERVFSYFLGLFVLTIAIGLSIKANLGISPVSSVPYTLTVVWGVEIGIATVIFHTVLVIIQYILLREKFGMKNLLQLPVGIVFGYFTSLSVFLMNFLPPANDIVMSLPAFKHYCHFNRRDTLPAGQSGCIGIFRNCSGNSGSSWKAVFPCKNSI